VLAICFTEAEAGSDYIIPAPDFTFQTQAVLRDDGLNELSRVERRRVDRELSGLDL